jgi:hypothetical protein
VVDHTRLGFSTRCQDCHGGFRFFPALMPSHEDCFHIAAGAHGGIRCQSCHSALSAAFTPGTCNTQTAACTGCHEHTCAKSDAEHTSVLGYQCRDRKCYECHQFAR